MKIWDEESFYDGRRKDIRPVATFFTVLPILYQISVLIQPEITHRQIFAAVIYLLFNIICFFLIYLSYRDKKYIWLISIAFYS
jgi:hypothetical protein